ncbi:sensor histidine kinase [Nocardia arizonensis]|uniref:sensor histidine kinase n=2 Tax=Nocardia arizonensis TaxID=1141647 RepID=UPI0007A761B6|nr:nitrate- and nitrite sensing domain-containing protein [Nocardia arizonensis]
MFVINFIRAVVAAVARRWRERGSISVRTRVLAIVLIPSVALLGIGVGSAIYLIRDGQDAEEWAGLASATAEPARQMIEAFQAERAASLLHLSGDPSATASLTLTRKNSDLALAALKAQGDAAAALRPDLANDIDGFSQLYAQLPTLRAAIDARAVPTDQAFSLYSTVIDTIVTASLLAAEVAPDPNIAVRLYQAMLLLRAGESISRAATIGSVALLTEELPRRQFAEFSRYVGDARGQLDYVASTLSGKRQEQLKNLIEGQNRKQIVAMEDAVIRRGVVEPDDPENSTGARQTNGTASRTTRTSADALPLTAAEWQSTAVPISNGLVQLWVDLCRDSHTSATTTGQERAANSAYGGAVVFAITVLVFLAAALLAGRLIGRMRRLRQETLELADERLPETIRTLSDGEQVDGDAVHSPLKFGGDEIGQVADAFNRAHSAAVTAAVAESKTRSGVNAVFVNIAHRSQVMVHRQLALLDRAEREEEDPGKLDLLFQLDHLATRARRNAENLIILGGDKPGRRWRNPVPLLDVVRSAVAESLDYTRIRTGRVPDIRIAGSAVADLIHLIAELTDNGTAYSPPESWVEVSGHTAGTGVAIEISDQGLGMSDTELAERNALLADPPDFSVASLAGDARLGLFVVAKLAARHGVTVRLSESDYGGIRAVVRVPTTLVATGDETSELARLPVRVHLSNGQGADSATAE